MSQANELAAEAFQQAIQRITQARNESRTRITFRPLRHLEAIPSDIGLLRQLTVLDFSHTGIADLSPISTLRSLRSLNISYTKVTDLHPIRQLSKLEYLYLDGDSIVDISLLPALSGLRRLSIDGSSVQDLSPLSELTHLRELTLRDSNVSDLSPLAALGKLKKLHFSDTKISDIAALAALTSLCEGAVHTKFGGIYYARTPVTDSYVRDMAFHPDPERTCIVINYLRRAAGLKEYWPRGYHGSRNIGKPEEKVAPDDLDPPEATALEQRPAPYRFRWNGKNVSARPQRGQVFDHKLARDLLIAIRRKASDALAFHVGNHVDEILARKIEDLLDILGDPPSRIREGVLLMSFRSLEAHLAAHAQTPDDVDSVGLSLLLDLTTSVEDLMALYPGVRSIEANRQSLRFQANNSELSQYTDYVQAVTNIASASRVVHKSVLEALSDGVTEIRELSLSIEKATTDTKVAALVEQRARIAGLQALDVRNFVAASLAGVRAEFGPVAHASWREIKAAIPRGLGDGVRGTMAASIKVGIAGLVAMIAGPVAGLSLLIASFTPLRRSAERVHRAMEDDEDLGQLLTSMEDHMANKDTENLT